jgi:hypothetical protein
MIGLDAASSNCMLPTQEVDMIFRRAALAAVMLTDAVRAK